MKTKQRQGQYIFNLLEFMKSKGVSGNQNDRLADIFHLSDSAFEKLKAEFDNQKDK